MTKFSFSTMGVAYLGIADNVSGPLASQLIGVNPPIIHTRKAFSTPRATQLNCI
jgi:hypothetical protein